MDIKDICGNVVSNRIQEEKSRNMDGYLGYVDGIMPVIQSKIHVYNNAALAEKSMKSGVYNVGYFGSIYPLHYLKQEPGFYSWFRFFPRVFRGVNYDKSGDNALLQIIERGG